MAIGIAFGVIVIFVAILLIVSRINERRRLQRIEREDRAKIDAEAVRIAALPRLDVSHMLPVQMTDSEIESSKKYGGTFGSRYTHMIVVDRDGRQYLCFKTPRNIEALWRSEFHGTRLTPYLIEHEENFIVDKEEIGVYPAVLKRFDKDSLVWKMWAKLHREENALGPLAGTIAYNKFFDLCSPREVPLSQASA